MTQSTSVLQGHLERLKIQLSLLFDEHSVRCKSIYVPASMVLNDTASGNFQMLLSCNRTGTTRTVWAHRMDNKDGPTLLVTKDDSELKKDDQSKPYYSVTLKLLIESTRPLVIRLVEKRLGDERYKNRKERSQG